MEKLSTTLKSWAIIALAKLSESSDKKKKQGKNEIWTPRQDIEVWQCSGWFECARMLARDARKISIGFYTMSLTKVPNTWMLQKVSIFQNLKSFILHPLLLWDDTGSTRTPDFVKWLKSLRLVFLYILFSYLLLGLPSFDPKRWIDKEIC